jgi:hypothetical protein
MKQKFTQIPKLLIICLLAFLGSCQKDFEEVNANQTAFNPNLKTYYLTGSKAQAIAEKLSKRLGRPISSKTTSLRMEGGTEIDYSSIMVVENEFSDKSYSFKVNSSAESATTFQNMVYVEKLTGVSTKLITYNMDADFAADYAADLKNIMQFKGTIKITETEPENCCSLPANEIIVLPGSNGGGSEPTSGSGSNNGSSNNNSNGSSGTASGATGGWGLGYGGSGSGSSSATGTSGSSSGSGSGSASGGAINLPRCPSGRHLRGDINCDYTKKDITPTLSNRMAVNNTIAQGGNTPPVLCCIFDIGVYEDVIFQKDCEKLKALAGGIGTQNIKPDMDWLKGKINDPVESAVTFHKISDYNGGYNHTNTQITSPNTNSVEFPLGAVIYTEQHTRTQQKAILCFRLAT